MLAKEEKYIFKKTLSRDTTLFTQTLWAQSLNERLREEHGLTNPCSPMFAHFANDGVIEIWENESAIKWLLDSLLLINQEKPEFLYDVLGEYRGLLSKIDDLHKKGMSLEESDIILYRELIYQAAMNASLFFYIGDDVRHTKEVIDTAMIGRKLANFFATNDEFIREYLCQFNVINKEQAALVLPDEIFNLPSEEVLSKRQKGLVVIDGKNSFEGSLKELSDEYSQCIFEDDQPVDANEEINGQVAFQGVVKGVAKIVKKQSDLKKVNSGDIMVSPMTTPDFISAMRLSTAFVTDEGGITCHAAIVAREMKKPCVIGTKIATRVIKDGDLIEVDAINGVVKILKKVKSR